MVFAVIAFSRMRGSAADSSLVVLVIMSCALYTYTCNVHFVLSIAICTEALSTNNDSNLEKD